MIQLGEIAKIKAGYPFRGAVKPDPSGDAHVVQMRDLRVDESGIDWSSAVVTTLSGNRAPDWLVSGDILMPSVGGRNKPVFVSDVPAPAVCSPHIFLIRIREGIAVPGYVAWVLGQAPVQRQIAGTATGGTVKVLRRAVLENIALPLPPLDQQRRIAQVYTAAREERRLLEKLIANREHQLAGIAQKLFNEETNHEVVS